MNQPICTANQYLSFATVAPTATAKPTTKAATTTAALSKDPSCAAVGLTTASGCRQCNTAEVYAMMSQVPETCQDKFKAAIKEFTDTGTVSMTEAEACPCYVKHSAPETILQCYFVPGQYPLKFAYKNCANQPSSK